MVCRHLLQLNPDNQRYHEGLQTTLGLQPDAQGAWKEEQREKLEELYYDLAERFSKSNATRRIPLDFKVLASSPWDMSGSRGSWCRVDQLSWTWLCTDV